MEKKGVKIVTIGGGSSYTPELMEGFIKRYEELPIREIWLVDVEGGKEKLEIVGALAQRMWDASPYDVKVHPVSYTHLDVYKRQNLWWKRLYSTQGTAEGTQALRTRAAGRATTP